MVMSEHSTVVGVFTDNAQAEQAINELLRVGFSNDEISVSRGAAATGGFIDSLKSLFTRQETPAATTAHDFNLMGVPEQDADFYQDELNAGRTIVLVRAAGMEPEAFGILGLYGAYDATTSRI